jgi:hypothetical protein
MGCKEGSVLAPVDETGGVNAEPTLYGISSTPDNPDHVKGGKTRGELVSAKFGGTVSNNRVSLEFPAGALDEDTYITIQMLDKSNLRVEFGPEGLVFNKPVTITWKLTGTTRESQAANTTIKWFDSETGTLEDIYNFPPDEPNKASGLIEHFSEYDLIGG